MSLAGRVLCIVDKQVAPRYTRILGHRGKRLSYSKTLCSARSYSPLIFRRNMASSSKTAASSLIRLGEDVWLQEAARSKKADEKTSDPDLIVVFSWMNGRLNHVQKYTDKYRAIFPTSDLVIVPSASELFYRSRKALDGRFKPLAEQLKSRNIISATSAPATSPKVHLHIFSNGGAMLFIYFMLYLQRIKHLSAPFPATTVVLDSLPGPNNLGGMLRAFTAGVKNAFTRYAIYGVLTMVWLGGRLYSHVLRLGEDIFVKMEKRLRSTTFLSKDTPRLYIYSKTDELMPYQYIEQHIAQTRRDGFNVETDRFDKSPHVAHARTDPARYWGEIERFYRKHAV